MKDNAQTIGQLVGHKGVRDAAHTPIISAVATTDMLTGAWVQLTENMEAIMVPRGAGVGIVDPYLLEQVKQGEQFWVHLKPGSIATLTHHWTHRQIADVGSTVPEKELARLRLEEFAEKELNVTLDRMLNAIENCRDGGDPLLSWSYESLSEYDGFWNDYEIFTGKTDPNKEEGYFYFFTCGGCS